MKILIEVAQNCKDWNQHKEIDKQLITNVTNTTCKMVIDLSNVQLLELSILLTDDQEMQLLNKKFRKKNKSTNVLSFPDEYWNQGLSDALKSERLYLGDIAFSYQNIYNESISQDKYFINHFIHLLVHSILHLIGFTHEQDSDSQIMEDLEIKILTMFNISSPY
ncbi:MAG: rRNA maturation RNase YbeY [Rickettsiaceae bacterium]